MRRRLFGGAAAGLALVAAATKAAETGHRIVLHVGSDDPGLMRTALNNIVNAQDAYAAMGQTVAIELVANGPGYAMLRADTSPVKARLAEVHQLHPAVVFSACQMSRKAIAAAEHKTLLEIPQVAEARDVPAGIVRIAELQEQGWAYLRV